MTRDPSPVRWEPKLGLTPKGPLTALRESIPYTPPAIQERPYVPPMRGNPLPFHSWAILCLAWIGLIGLVLWSLNHG